MITSYEKYEMLLKISETNSYQVANDTGVGYSSLSDWKRGKSRLKTDKLRILAEYFGVDTGFFRDGDAITGYDIIKDYAFVSTCNRARNLEWLRNSPYEPFLDMALIYNLTIGIGSMPDRSVHISDSHLELLGINKQTLKESAWENTKRIRPACTASMGRFMREVGYADALKENPGGTTYGDDVIPAFMLSSEHGYHGAVYMLDNKTMKKAAAELKGNLIVLPYSIHVVFLLKDIPEADELLSTAASLNLFDPEADDFLSDHIYRYNAERGILSIVGSPSVQSVML